MSDLIQPKERTEERAETHASDLISRQAAIDAMRKYEVELPIYTPREVDIFWNDAIDACCEAVEALPPAQPDLSTYSDKLWQAAYTADMVRLLSDIRANYNCMDEKEEPYYRALSEAIRLASVQSDRKRGKWTKENACEICGFQPWYERDIHTLSFCPHCGADMREKDND